MPYATSADSARIWATERAIKLFAVFAGDLATNDIKTLTALSPMLKQDGARFAVIVPEGGQPTAEERLLADIFVESKPAPSPFGLFLALEAFDLPDTRQLGVIGGSVAVLDAGHRAGAGAIIGIAGIAIAARRPLLLGQPDVIVAAEEFAALDRDRYSSQRASRQRVQLTPDATLSSDKVQRALLAPALSPTDPRFARLVESIRGRLFQAIAAPSDWSLALLPGDETTALTAILGGGMRPGRKALICSNGASGDRLQSIAKRLGLATVSISSPAWEPIDPAAVAAALDAHHDIDAVALAHHELSRGMINPVDRIAAEARTRGALVVLDAGGSIAVEELDLSAGDFVAAASDKGARGIAGVALALVASRGRRRLDQAPPGANTTGLRDTLRAQSSGDFAAAPPSQLLHALDAALDELQDEGAAFRRASYAIKIEQLDEAFARLGLETAVAPEHRSRALRTLPLPAGISFEVLHDALKSRGYVIAPGPNSEMFQVAIFGAITIEALRGFIETLERAIARFSPSGASV